MNTANTIPAPADFFREEQANGASFEAEEIYNDTVAYLNSINALHVVPIALIYQYAANTARWIQCEHLTSQNGLVIGSEDGGLKRNPAISLSLQYGKRAGDVLEQISRITKAHQAERDADTNIFKDTVERLHTARNTDDF
ncbi:hypothetical protein FACS18949_02730 [Clostridia bacterium]|nr:hypothetical protein FACS189425_06340 [Clostridia bacterium]GHV32291.1 hypothetical protein FACS18949_02730 [Clostridia bacterium]